MIRVTPRNAAPTRVNFSNLGGKLRGYCRHLMEESGARARCVHRPPVPMARIEERLTVFVQSISGKKKNIISYYYKFL